MSEIENSKPYDLEGRTADFARAVKEFVVKVPRELININDIKQLLRASSSVGANFIEANEAISRKDFLHRVKICRKEIKESIYWFNLMTIKSEQLNVERLKLEKEAIELMKIFGAIIRNSNFRN